MRQFLNNKTAGEKAAAESLGGEAVQRLEAPEAAEAKAEPGEQKKDANDAK